MQGRVISENAVVAQTASTEDTWQWTFNSSDGMSSLMQRDLGTDEEGSKGQCIPSVSLARPPVG